MESAKVTRSEPLYLNPGESKTARLSDLLQQVHEGSLSGESAQVSAEACFNSLEYPEGGPALDPRLDAWEKINEYDLMLSILDAAYPNGLPADTEGYHEAISSRLTILRESERQANTSPYSAATLYDSGDVKNYRNPLPISALLLNEQLVRASVANGPEAPKINTDTIKSVCRLRSKYPKIHDEPVLTEKIDQLDGFLEELDQAEVQLKSEYPEQHAALAITLLLTAKTVHDLAVFGEIGKHERTSILTQALSLLWEASDIIKKSPLTTYSREEASGGDAITGIAEDIITHLHMYAKELGLNPDERPKLISDKEIQELLDTEPSTLPQVA